MVSEKKMLKIRQEISENHSGWQAKEIMNIIYKKTGVRYHEVHIYRLLHKWGFSPNVHQKRFVNTTPNEEKETFKNSTGNTLANPGRIHYSSVHDESISRSCIINTHQKILKIHFYHMKSAS